MNGLDTLITKADRMLRTLLPPPRPTAPSPARKFPETELSTTARLHCAGLMRVNHAGEVCAQALYRGQALIERDPEVRALLQEAADEERDHLAWCRERLQQLRSKPSRLNPLWYSASMITGVMAGSMGRHIGLGFIAATEEQVCLHLDRHLDLLPAHDEKSRQILLRMRTDEMQHGHRALEIGGVDFPQPVKSAMGCVAQLMTRSSYYL